MFSPAMVIALDHINELHVEAAQNRLAKQAKRPASRSAKSRISAAATSLRSLLTSPAEAPLLTIPKLTDYPYRS